MIEIVFASQNEHKIKEVNEITTPFKITAVAPSVGFNPVENAQTFEENSLIKASEAVRVEVQGRKFFLADDSGLEIEALNNEPGIYSARYAETPEARIQKVLDNLKDKENRNARFVCAMTLLNEKGEVLYKTKGICKGKIAFEPKGENGFGYDPIFIPEGYDVSMAELPEKTKNLISHRGRALIEVVLWMKLSKKL